MLFSTIDSDTVWRLFVPLGISCTCLSGSLLPDQYLISDLSDNSNLGVPGRISFCKNGSTKFSTEWLSLVNNLGICCFISLMDFFPPRRMQYLLNMFALVSVPCRSSLNKGNSETIYVWDRNGTPSPLEGQCPTMHKLVILRNHWDCTCNEIWVHRCSLIAIAYPKIQWWRE